jgi:hypothetical protein
MLLLQRTFRPILPLGLVLVVVLAACDSGNDDFRLTDSSYELDVAGDGIDASFRGNALFGEDSDDGEPYFAIVFTDQTDIDAIDAEEDNFGAFVRQGSGVSRREYVVADIASSSLDSGDFLFLLSEEEGTDVYVSRGGTLTITSRSSSIIEGSFNVPGTRVRYAEDTTVTDVTIAGNFEAVNPDNLEDVFRFLVPTGPQFVFNVPLPIFSRPALSDGATSGELK